MNHITQVEHWRAWGVRTAPNRPSVERLIRNIASDPRIRNILKVKFGDDIVKNFDTLYTNMVGTRRQQHGMKQKVLAFLRNNYGPSMTGGKPLQLAKQFTGVLMGLKAMSPSELSAGVTHYWLNKKKADAILNQNGYFATLDGNVTFELQAQKEANNNAFMAGLHSVDSWFTTAGMKYTTRPMAWAFVQAKKGEMGEAEAVAAAAELADTTQGSINIHQQSIIEQTDWGKIYMLYHKQPMQAEIAEINAFRRVLSNGTIANQKALVKAVAAAHFSQFMFQIVASLPTLLMSEDDDEKNLELVRIAAAGTMGPLGGPVLGEILNAAIVASYAHTIGVDAFKTYEPRYVPFQIATKVYKLVLKGIEAGNKAANDEYAPEDKDWWDNLQLMAEIYSTFAPKQLGGGLSLGTQVKHARGLVGE